jgi:branched-chain amino acid transport system permease protein
MAAFRKAKPFVSIAVVAAVGLAACFVSDDQSYQYALAIVLIWATVGGSWNIISGYGGQMAFGHAVFFGAGAYVSTLCMVYWHITPIVGVVPGMAVAVAGSLVIGMPTFRLSGVYFSLATLAFPLMLIPVLSYLNLQEVSMPFVREGAAWYLQFDNPLGYSLLALGLLVVSLLVVRGIEESRLGPSLLAIRDDEWAAEASGIDAYRTKLKAFAISAAIAAAAGALYASLLLVVTPQSVFGLPVTIKSLMVALVGGLATVWGAIIGAVILIPLGQYLLLHFGSTYPGIDNVVLGLFLMAVIVWAPEGLYWKARDLLVRAMPKVPEASVAVVSLESAPIALREPAKDVSVVLSVQGVAKSFAGLRAVNDVTFDVRAGEILGIIGPNGAGKTTLINLINGFARADEGHVLLGGQDVTADAPWKIRRRGVGRTFQMPRVLARRSVLHNVDLGGFHVTRSVVEAEGLADQALGRVGLISRRDDLPANLSTLELRKLELARALVSNPDILLLDEPLAGLSGGESSEICDLIRRLRAEGVTILIIEHTMSAMVSLVDRFIVLDQGKLLAEGAPDAVMANEQVIEAYLGKGWAKNA